MTLLPPTDISELEHLGLSREGESGINRTELRSRGGNAEMSPGCSTKSYMRSCLSLCSSRRQKIGSKMSAG